METYIYLQSIYYKTVLIVSAGHHVVFFYFAESNGAETQTETPPPTPQGLRNIPPPTPLRETPVFTEIPLFRDRFVGDGTLRRFPGSAGKTPSPRNGN